MLVETGRPVPQPESEALVRVALREIDPLLDVRWFAHSVYSTITESLEGRYAIICTWPQNDKRWIDFRSGAIGEPFDILGWLTDASGSLADWFEPESPGAPDIAALIPRIQEMLGRCDNERQPWAQRMKGAIDHNARQRASVKALAAEEMLDAFAYHGKRMKKEPIVGLGTGESEKHDPRLRQTGRKWKARDPFA